MDFCSKNASLHKRQHQFRIGFYSVVCLSDTFLGFAVESIFDLKNLPKNLPKQSPIPSIIDAENTLFFNIDFFMFWVDFGISWPSKIEPSWSFGPPKTRDDAPFEPS